MLSRMPLQDKSRFPITLWPAAPLSPVLVERWSVKADDRGTLHWGAAEDPQELPSEWVLRQLADADLDDDAAITGLLEYGAISHPYFNTTHVPANRREMLGHLPSLDEQSTDWWKRYDNGTLEDVRWWMKTARALAGVWAEASSGRDPGSAWAAEGFAALADERACWAYFAIALNIGLGPFQARIEHRSKFSFGEVAYGLPQVGLYSAACRQVFNFIVSEETARRCENQTCGRTFVHQLGGAQHGQYRSKGLLRFCSPECARAETQRQYRRRKATQKEQP
jgi:hypothetical protein